MNTAEYLTQLIDCKEDIKSVIIEKGVTPTGGLSTYADAISSLNLFPNGTKFAYSEFTEAPFFDTSQYTDMQSMFENCRSLTNVPEYDTSNVTDMSYMFENCISLSVIPIFDTSKVTDMIGMFRRNSYVISGTGVTIERIPLMDCGNVEFFEPFDHNPYSVVNVNYVEGFKDLGKSITEDYIAAAAHKNVSFRNANLNRESKVNIINNLYNIASQNKTLSLQMFVRDLSDEEIAVATNKGWTIFDD